MTDPKDSKKPSSPKPTSQGPKNDSSGKGPFTGKPGQTFMGSEGLKKQPKKNK